MRKNEIKIIKHSSNNKHKSMKCLKYIDLCCGIGGFRMGINYFQKTHPKFKFECVFSADIKDDAIKTYDTNFNTNIGRVNIYDIEKLPKFDMLCAGFPCQPFSSAGNKKGFDDKRGGLIFKIVDICKEYKPSIVLLENVANLLCLGNGKIIKKIEKLFTGINYNITYTKLNALDFGVPQSRERVYIVCCPVDKHIDLSIVKTQTRVHLSDIIDTMDKRIDIEENLAKKLLALHKQENIYGCKLQDKRGGNKNIHSWDIGLNGKISKKERQLMNIIMTERRKKHWAIKKKIKWMDGMPLTYEEIKTFYDDDNLKKMLSNLVEKKYLKMEKCKDLVDGKRQYKDDSEVGYNICKGKLSFPISKILDPNKYAPTLTATDSTRLAVIIDDKYIRRLNHNELKKLCGFPHDYIIPDGVNEYDLFGNMVVPNVITALLEFIL